MLLRNWLDVGMSLHIMSRPRLHAAAADADTTTDAAELNEPERCSCAEPKICDTLMHWQAFYTTSTKQYPASMHRQMGKRMLIFHVKDKVWSDRHTVVYFMQLVVDNLQQLNSFVLQSTTLRCWLVKATHLYVSTTAAIPSKWAAAEMPTIDGCQ